MGWGYDDPSAESRQAEADYASRSRERVEWRRGPVGPRGKMTVTEHSATVSKIPYPLRVEGFEPREYYCGRIVFIVGGLLPELSYIDTIRSTGGCGTLVVTDPQPMSDWLGVDALSVGDQIVLEYCRFENERAKGHWRLARKED